MKRSNRPSDMQRSESKKVASDRNTEGKYKHIYVIPKSSTSVNRIVIDSFPLLCTQTVTLSRDTAPGSHAIKIRRVTSKSDSLFPIILWGFRLPYDINVGKSTEDVGPGHIKGSARSLVPRLRETLSTMVHFTRGCSTSVTMMRVSCVEMKCNMWLTEKQESDACRTFFFFFWLSPCAGQVSGSDSERRSAGVASHFFSHALCIVGGSEVEK